MSAVDFTVLRPYCIACGDEKVDPHLHLGGDVNDHGQPVDVYGYKCLDCGERFHGYVLQQPDPLDERYAERVSKLIDTNIPCVNTSFLVRLDECEGIESVMLSEVRCEDGQSYEEDDLAFLEDDLEFYDSLQDLMPYVRQFGDSGYLWWPSPPPDETKQPV